MGRIEWEERKWFLVSGWGKDHESKVDSALDSFQSIYVYGKLQANKTHTDTGNLSDTHRETYNTKAHTEIIRVHKRYTKDTQKIHKKIHKHKGRN